MILFKTPFLLSAQFQGVSAVAREAPGVRTALELQGTTHGLSSVENELKGRFLPSGGFYRGPE